MDKPQHPDLIVDLSGTMSATAECKRANLIVEESPTVNLSGTITASADLRGSLTVDPPCE